MKKNLLEQDTFLKEILAKELLPTLPDNFTQKLMATVEQEVAIKARIYRPLISRTQWQYILIIIGGLLLFQITAILLVSVSWPDMVKLSFSPGNKSSPFTRIFTNYSSGYLPKLVIISAICAGLWLIEKLRYYFWQRSKIL